MAPVSGYSKKGILHTLAEKGEKVVSRMLSRKHNGVVTKRKTRRGEAPREHGLKKVVKRGMSVALGAYGLARKTAVLGGVQGVVADALVQTTCGLLGIQDTQQVGKSIPAGWNVKCETVREGGRRSLSLSFAKTPQGCEARDFHSRLEFISPSDDFIRVPGGEEYIQEEGNRVHSGHRRRSSRTRSRVQPDMTNSYFSSGASATRLAISTPQLPAPHCPLIQPKTEPGTRTPPGFITIPLSTPQADPQVYPRIKRERIKQEIPY